MKIKIANWVRENPIIAFFSLALILCYFTLFPAIYLFPRDNTIGQILGYYFAKIGVFSPVISGIIVSMILSTERKTIPWLRRMGIFLPVWLFALLVNIISLKTTASTDIPIAGLIILSVPVALLPAWVISSAFDGRSQVKKMLGSFVRLRGSIIYYLIALFTFPVIHIIGTVSINFLEGKTLFPQMNLEADFFLTILITFISVFFFAGGINEESGWRGFAQNYLQVKYSPLITALMLWFYMVIWHVPNDLLQYQNGGYIEVRWGLYPFITILFTWIYNRTNGSILAVAIFHSSMNSMNPLMGIFPNTIVSNALLVGFALAVIFVDRMWKKLPKDHPAVHNNNDIISTTETFA